MFARMTFFSSPSGAIIVFPVCWPRSWDGTAENYFWLTRWNKTSWTLIYVIWVWDKNRNCFGLIRSILGRMLRWKATLVVINDESDCQRQDTHEKPHPNRLWHKVQDFPGVWEEWHHIGPIWTQWGLLEVPVGTVSKTSSAPYINKKGPF